MLYIIIIIILLHDDMVPEATRMTKWNNNTKLENHADMVYVVMTGKEQSARFTRGYWSFRKNSASIARSLATMPRHTYTGRKFRPSDVAQDDITPTNSRTTNN